MIHVMWFLSLLSLSFRSTRQRSTSHADTLLVGLPDPPLPPSTGSALSAAVVESFCEALAVFAFAHADR